MKIFTINPGSTSTKVALFEDGVRTFSASIDHLASELSAFATLADQLPYRADAIEGALSGSDVSLDGCDAFAGRGGGLLPMESGVYEVDDLMLDHAAHSANGVVHPANLGTILADRLAREHGGRALMVDCPDVDEFIDVARITGMRGVLRYSAIHALNQKEVARRHAAVLGRPYEDCNFVVCHIGGGISVAAHRRGKMIDGNDIKGGDGPMSPTRLGSVPAETLIHLCFSGRYTEDELVHKCVKDGGFVDHLGTSDSREVCAMAESGDVYAGLVWDTCIYQIVKYIGSMAAVLEGDVDGILLSGGMTNNTGLVRAISDACSFIAPVTAYPGEFEMEAMAAGAERVLSGQEEAKRYTGVSVVDEFRAKYGLE